MSAAKTSGKSEPANRTGQSSAVGKKPRAPAVILPAELAERLLNLKDHRILRESLVPLSTPFDVLVFYGRAVLTERTARYILRNRRSLLPRQMATLSACVLSVDNLEAVFATLGLLSLLAPKEGAQIGQSPQGKADMVFAVIGELAEILLRDRSVEPTLSNLVMFVIKEAIQPKTAPDTPAPIPAPPAVPTIHRTNSAAAVATIEPPMELPRPRTPVSLSASTASNPEEFIDIAEFTDVFQQLSESISPTVDRQLIKVIRTRIPMELLPQFATHIEENYLLTLQDLLDRHNPSSPNYSLQRMINAVKVQIALRLELVATFKSECCINLKTNTSSSRRLDAEASSAVIREIGQLLGSVSFYLDTESEAGTDYYLTSLLLPLYLSYIPVTMGKIYRYTERDVPPALRQRLNEIKEYLRLTAPRPQEIDEMDVEPANVPLSPRSDHRTPQQSQDIDVAGQSSDSEPSLGLSSLPSLPSLPTEPKPLGTRSPGKLRISFDPSKLAQQLAGAMDQFTAGPDSPTKKRKEPDYGKLDINSRQTKNPKLTPQSSRGLSKTQ